MKVMIVALCALLLLAACGGENQLQDDQLPPPPDTGADDTVAQVQDDVQHAGTDDEPATNAAQKKLEEIFDGAVNEFTVTYDMRSTINGESQESEMAMYVSGEKFRSDTKGDVDGQSFESQTFVTPEALISCNKQEGDWQCIRMETPEEENDMPVDLAENYEEQGEDFWNDYSVLDAPSRTIAGTKAKCFKLSVDVPGQGMTSQEYCYSKEGVPLYIELSMPDGTMIQEATSYKTSVSSSDFEPPAEPQDMEAMMQQMMEQYGGLEQ